MVLCPNIWHQNNHKNVSMSFRNKYSIQHNISPPIIQNVLKRHLYVVLCFYSNWYFRETPGGIILVILLSLGGAALLMSDSALCETDVEPLCMLCWPHVIISHYWVLCIPPTCASLAFVFILWHETHKKLYCWFGGVKPVFGQRYHFCIQLFWYPGNS